MTGFATLIQAAASKEAASTRRQPERLAEAIEATASALALLCAAGSNGDDKAANTLLEGASQHAFQSVGRFVRVVRLMR